LDEETPEKEKTMIRYEKGKEKSKGKDKGGKKKK